MIVPSACTYPPASPTQSSQASTGSRAQLSAKQLPDFAALADREGEAVVNISTTQTVRKPADIPELRDLPKDSPLHEFFRRLVPPEDSGPNELSVRSLGSGFIISDDGYIVSSAHVISGADEVTVKLRDKREFQAKVVGIDLPSDVALVKIDAQGLPKVTMGKSANLRIAEWVVAIGSPFGFESSVTAGIVSAKGRSLPGDQYVPFIQTDVAMNPGSSGGPLFNLEGKVVGMNAQIVSGSGGGGFIGVSFAIPIEVAMDVSAKLQAEGKVTRGLLGIETQELTPELASSLGSPGASGALVARVGKGSPAERAGLRVGDVVVKYGSKAIDRSRDLPPAVAATRPGTTISVHVLREGRAQKIDVVIGELPGEKVVEARKESDPSAVGVGLTLVELTPAQRRHARGVVVKNSEGNAAKAGIQRGDLIVQVNQTDVTSVEQVQQLLKSHPSGDVVAMLVQRSNQTRFVAVKVG